MKIRSKRRLGKWELILSNDLKEGCNMTSKAPDCVPSVKEYKSTFTKIKEQMTENQLQMLVEHY